MSSAGQQCNGITIPTKKSSLSKASELSDEETTVFSVEDFPVQSSSLGCCESEIVTVSSPGTPGGERGQTYLQLPLVLPSKSRRRHSWFCG